VSFHFPGGGFGVAGDDCFDGGVVEARGVEFLGVGLDGLDDLFREPHDAGDESFEEAVPAHFGENVVNGGLPVHLLGEG